MGATFNPPPGAVVEPHDEIVAEFEAFNHDVQDNLLAAAKALQIADARFDSHLKTAAGAGKRKG